MSIDGLTPTRKISPMTHSVTWTIWNPSRSERRLRVMKSLICALAMRLRTNSTSGVTILNINFVPGRSTPQLKPTSPSIAALFLR